MKFALASVLFSLLAVPPAAALDRVPAESRSHITVLVDMSGTWLNARSQADDKRVLTAVSQTIVAMIPALKPPISVRYLAIGDESLSRRPLCEAEFVPSIFPSMAPTSVFADVDKFAQFLGTDCPRFILLHKPEAFTDITGALNTVARVSMLEDATYSALIVLSDFKEERRPNQQGNIGSLKGIHTLLLYRVLDEDRYQPKDLDQRVHTWTANLRNAGASTTALDDLEIEPAELKRLLSQ